MSNCKGVLIYSFSLGTFNSVELCLPFSGPCSLLAFRSVTDTRTLTLSPEVPLELLVRSRDLFGQFFFFFFRFPTQMILLARSIHVQPPCLLSFLHLTVKLSCNVQCDVRIDLPCSWFWWESVCIPCHDRGFVDNLYHVGQQKGTLKNFLPNAFSVPLISSPHDNFLCFFLPFFYFPFFFQTESHYVQPGICYVNKTDFEFTEIHSPLPQKYWD